jgi:hypothetical protein
VFGHDLLLRDPFSGKFVGALDLDHLIDVRGMADSVFRISGTLVLCIHWLGFGSGFGYLLGLRWLQAGMALGGIHLLPKGVYIHGRAVNSGQRFALFFLSARETRIRTRYKSVNLD